MVPHIWSGRLDRFIFCTIMPPTAIYYSPRSYRVPHHHRFLYYSNGKLPCLCPSNCQSWPRPSHFCFTSHQTQQQQHASTFIKSSGKEQRHMVPLFSGVVPFLHPPPERPRRRRLRLLQGRCCCWWFSLTTTSWQSRCRRGKSVSLKERGG